MNLSDLLILLSIIEFSSHIFAKLQLCIGYRITSTHSCAEDFTLEPETFFNRIHTICKGQLISKFLFGISNFFQKTNENKSTLGIIPSNSFVLGLTICFRVLLTFRHPFLEIWAKMKNFLRLSHL